MAITSTVITTSTKLNPAFDVLVEQGDNVEIGEATLRNRRLEGLALRDLRLPGNALIMGIRREGMVFSLLPGLSPHSVNLEPRWRAS